MTVSGLSDTLSIPSSTSHLAKSGWSDGLTANTDVFVLFAAGRDCQVQHHFNGRVTLVEGVRYQTAVTVEAEGQLGHVVRADGEAVEVLQELFCQYSVAW